MPTPDPYWTDGKGRRLPPKPCRKCGDNVGPMPLRVEPLRHLGWQPYTEHSYQSSCGHRLEIIPFPLADGRVRFVPVVGEARKSGGRSEHRKSRLARRQDPPARRPDPRTAGAQQRRP